MKSVEAITKYNFKKNAEMHVSFFLKQLSKYQPQH